MRDEEIGGDEERDDMREPRDGALLFEPPTFTRRAMTFQTASQPPHISTKSETKSQWVNIGQP